ncbi:M56 family metallopeptidase [Clostridium formicaceticum]|uniref:Regulatory protein BlaR1 n=1 Tax=Clostridium formicaceticum TaxID=1497 RepID=A0AAC9RNF0_9CLOT|nr:M56 family metallopeptidase [Clostridium formicaceticum]AOY74542.1 hypothetical protein BJL90_00380 [Clostridium formicaceticum]ARE88899.1 Regulatory protein BlaR1 [Clostridium formicaceticum]
MSITIFSFITSIFWCNIYIAMIAFMRRRNSFLIHFSIAPLALLTVTSIFRLLCSVELPATVVLPSEIILPAVINFLTMSLFTAFDGVVVIRIYDVLLVVWVVGSIYNLQKYICQLIQLNNSVGVVDGTRDMRIILCMDEIIAKSQKNMKVKIIQSKEISIPMITGFFKPTIYLPDIQFSDGELKNILLHEWTHFLHKDTWIKLSMYLISSVFWWNPFVHLLKHELNHVLEIQCDLSITSQMDEKDRIRYLESILKVMKSTGKKNFQHTIPVNSTALISTSKTKKIQQRFRLVLEYDGKKKQRIFPIFLLCGLILLSHFASYRFVIQPRYFPTVEAGYEETFIITPENSFLILNGDGTYSLYTDGQYRCNINQINEEPFSLLSVK